MKFQIHSIMYLLNEILIKFRTSFNFQLYFSRRDTIKKRKAWRSEWHSSQHFSLFLNRDKNAKRKNWWSSKRQSTRHLFVFSTGAKTKKKHEIAKLFNFQRETPTIFQFRKNCYTSRICHNCQNRLADEWGRVPVQLRESDKWKKASHPYADMPYLPPSGQTKSIFWPTSEAFSGILQSDLKIVNTIGFSVKFSVFLLFSTNSKREIVKTQGNKLPFIVCPAPLSAVHWNIIDAFAVGKFFDSAAIRTQSSYI